MKSVTPHLHSFIRLYRLFMQPAIVIKQVEKDELKRVKGDSVGILN